MSTLQRVIVYLALGVLLLLLNVPPMRFRESTLKQVPTKQIPTFNMPPQYETIETERDGRGVVLSTIFLPGERLSGLKQVRWRQLGKEMAGVIFGAGLLIGVIGLAGRRKRAN